MTGSNDELADALRIGINVLIRRYKIADASARLQNGSKLNVADTQAILFIGENPACTARQLGEFLGVVPTTTSTMVDRLVRQGVVSRRRTSTDRRIVQLSLTGLGQDAYVALVSTQKKHCEHMLAKLDADEQSALVEMIGKIAS